jgi:hypothetical protein
MTLFNVSEDVPRWRFTLAVLAAWVMPWAAVRAMQAQRAAHLRVVRRLGDALIEQGRMLGHVPAAEPEPRRLHLVK